MPAQALSANSSSGEEREADSMDNDDESLGDSEAKPKKLKKKKKKKAKDGEEGAVVVKKKKKKKKKPVAESEADADADGETNADADTAGVTANSSSTPSADGGHEYEEPLQQGEKVGLKMPVRRHSDLLDDIEISDVESDGGDDADDDATQKASGAQSTSGKRSNSTGTYDQHTHARFLKAQKARGETEATARGSYASPPANQIQSSYDNDSGSASDDQESPPQSSSYQDRPVRQRRGAHEKRYKSNSMGALDKRKYQIHRKKQSIRIAPGSRRHMRYVSSDDDDDSDDDRGGRGYGSQDYTGSESEGEMPLGGGRGGGRSSGDEIPSRPVRTRGGGPGLAKYRSNSAGILDKNVQDRFLDRHGTASDDGRSQDETSDDDEVSNGSGRPRRPVRNRRTSDQPRYRSSSAGILDKNARDIYNSRAPPNGSNFLKPRKRSAGAIKAKETLQRSAEESSLHQAQPNIRVALPRLRSVGALNARGSGSNSRRSSRDRFRSESDDSNDDGSPQEERKVQSERVLKTTSFNSDDDDSSSDLSSESEAIHVASAPLPKSFRPTRKWADASKQLDQLPSVRRTSSAQSVNKKPSATDAIAPPPLDDDDGGNVWTETLKDTAEKKKKKKKFKKKNSSDSLDSQSEQKPKAKKKKDKVRKSSAPGLESGSYH